jgi:hypothetical protein
MADRQIRMTAVKSRPHDWRRVDAGSFHVPERKRPHQGINVRAGLLENASITHEPVAGATG